jgi:hypothetical protein
MGLEAVEVEVGNQMINDEPLYQNEMKIVVMALNGVVHEFDYRQTYGEYKRNDLDYVAKAHVCFENHSHDEFSISVTSLARSTSTGDFSICRHWSHH